MHWIFFSGSHAGAWEPVQDLSLFQNCCYTGGGRYPAVVRAMVRSILYYLVACVYLQHSKIMCMPCTIMSLDVLWFCDT